MAAGAPGTSGRKIALELVRSFVSWLKNLNARLGQGSQVPEDVTTPPRFATVFDVLYEATGKPIFKTLADYLRPHPEDIGSAVSPLAAGKLTQAGQKVLKRLVREAYPASEISAVKVSPVAAVRKRESAYQSLRKLIAETLGEAGPEVELPPSRYATPSVERHAIQAFLQTILDLPERFRKRGPRRVKLASVSIEPSISGRYHPTQREAKVTIAPTYKMAPAWVPRTTLHEFVHGLTLGEPALRPHVLEYAGDVGWRGPQSAQYPLPIEMPELHQSWSSYYHEGWPGTLPGEVAEAPIPWEWRPPTWKGFPYGTRHPIEDVAEAGAYYLLGTAVRDLYPHVYSTRIKALFSPEQEVRLRALRKLLERATGAAP